MSKKFAVVLSGSGVYDGTEIHEAIAALLAIDRQGAKYQCFAPDIAQHHVINHLTGQEMNETRNVLVESARIARGQIKPLSEFKAVDYDVILLPGGYGAAKNLSSLAFKGSNCSVNAELEKAIIDMVEHKKPIGALCIAPAVLTCILKGANVTIGNDESTAQAIKEMGGVNIEKTHGEIVIDERFKLVTTPCYMLEASLSQIADGANNVVAALMQM